MKSKNKNSFINNFFSKNHKAAMEMSVGTIVTIVLLMSVLVLGIFLVQQIFGSAKGAIELTDAQLQSEISKLFGDSDSRLLLFPTSGEIEVKAGNEEAFGIGIRNVATNINDPTTFSYEVIYEGNTCGLSEAQVKNWIGLRGSGTNIEVGIDQIVTKKVVFSIPEGTPKCTGAFAVQVKRDGKPYDSEDVNIKRK